LYYSPNDGTGAGGRPSELDHMKATGQMKSDSVYADIHKS